MQQILTIRSDDSHNGYQVKHVRKTLKSAQECDETCEAVQLLFVSETRELDRGRSWNGDRFATKKTDAMGGRLARRLT